MVSLFSILNSTTEKHKEMLNVFTNIPLNETINIAVDLILKHNPRFSISKVISSNYWVSQHLKHIFYSITFMIKQRELLWVVL